MHTDSVFKHSGRFSVVGVATAILLGSAIGGFIGALYGVVAFYSPFFIINMAVLAAIAIATGVLLDKPIRNGHIRNTAVSAVVGLVAGSVSLAVHWIVWVRLSVEFWVLDFETMMNTLQVIALLGPWTIFDWTPTGGTLYFIWGIEALVLAVVPMIAARNIVRDTPYCEQTGRWAEVDYTKKNFASCDIEAMKLELLQNPSAVVSLLKDPAGEDSEFLRFGLGKVDGSPLRTVTISKVVAKVKDGKVEEDSRTVLNNLRIDTSTFEKMAAACS